MRCMPISTATTAVTTTITITVVTTTTTHRYCPTASDAFQDMLKLTDTFGPPPRLSDVVIRAKSGGSSVLTPEALGEAYEIHNMILNMTAEFDGEEVRYSDVCREVGTSCRRETIFDTTFSDVANAEALASMSQAQVTAAVTATVYDLGVVLGNTKYDATTGAVASAEALRN
jgi:hypothetical protein